ncbi:hypothetical protein FRB99_003691 [Tulasnella sp. 403]|nr:hypothetical protein FRB99_003691 [Tulasnella sp. 403]
MPSSPTDSKSSLLSADALSSFSSTEDPFLSPDDPVLSPVLDLIDSNSENILPSGMHTDSDLDPDPSVPNMASLSDSEEEYLRDNPSMWFQLYFNLPLQTTIFPFIHSPMVNPVQYIAAGKPLTLDVHKAVVQDAVSHTVVDITSWVHANGMIIPSQWVNSRLVLDHIVSPTVMNIYSGIPKIAASQMIRDGWKSRQSLMSNCVRQRLTTGDGITVYVFIWDREALQPCGAIAPSLFVRLLSTGTHYSLTEDYALMRHLRQTSSIMNGFVYHYDTVTGIWNPHTVYAEIPIPNAGMCIFIKAAGVTSTPWLFDIMTKMHPPIPY